MNQKNKKMLMIGIGVILIVGFISYFTMSRTNVDEINAATLTEEQMKEDLDELINKIKEVHPGVGEGFSEETENAISQAYEKIKNPMSGEEFSFVLNEVAATFKDSNTYINMYLSESTKAIDLNAVWLNDGLYVNEDIGQLKKGDKILSMGGKTPDEILQLLSASTSVDNTNWIKANYISNIILETYLEYMGLVKDDSVNIEVQRNTETLAVNLPLVNLVESQTYKTISGNNQKFYEEEFITYSVEPENKLAVLSINKFDDSSKFKKALKSFFEEVKENNIENVVVDLKNNIGGTDKGLVELMTYFDVDTYKYFTHYTKENIDEKQEENVVENKKVKDELLFKGNLYVVTSMKTFSTGNFFATVIKDNNLGTIVGEPTGSKPSMFANIDKFYKLPNSEYQYSVSNSQFIRPSGVVESENALIPDIEVYTTIDDVLNGKNAQLESVKELINK